ncbi:hypothetical protein CDD81_503 [Ophiocordyceps australis]|uniref:Wax synthase domain-containing protein n=1 Tax=Ophiocordyceps australis TaxID=1399860 RepID=A0A2C5Y0T9_9HYPO|nr:hypothetical protein CDD81_503 [Ophiocordyceps australis]
MDAAVAAQRAVYRAPFARDVASGQAHPFVIPYTILSSFALPALWLAIPHVGRPWLYRSRWIVVALVLVVNRYLLLRSSSENFGLAYATGLTLAWGFATCFDLLILRTPQVDEARILKVPAAQALPKHPQNASEESSRVVNGQDSASPSLRRRHDKLGSNATNHYSTKLPPDTETYIWEPYPRDASFLYRLGWSLDLIISLRGAGWSTAIASIPRPKTPAHIAHGDAVDISAMPRVSRSGYECSMTEGSFVRTRLCRLLVCYFFIDFISASCSFDPYFLYGPEHTHQRPSYLPDASPLLVLVYREVATITIVVTTLETANCFYSLSTYFLLKKWFPARAVLWHFPSTFGSLSQVFDRGMAGLWGAWWHQILRQGFTAPVTYLFKHGYLEKKSKLAGIVAVLVSFTLSGSLHALGSFTALPDTNPWRPFSYFVLQAVGVLVQQALSEALRCVLPRVPRTLARITNLVFVVAWMCCTSVLFIDDIASSGVWLSEAVPVSPSRLLGIVPSTGSWWRWTIYEFPRWHWGTHWWQSGFAL